MKITNALFSLFALLQVWMANAGNLSPLEQRGFFIGSALALTYLSAAHASADRRLTPLYFLLALAGAYGGYHVGIHSDRLMDFMNELTRFDFIAGVVTLALVLDCTRRTTGVTLPLMAVVLLVYLFYGHSILSGYFAPPRFSYITGIETFYASTSGIFGFMTDVGARIIAVYVVFGALLMSLGAGRAFIRMAQLVSGRSRGGAAKVSVISSALFGTVSGSAVANVMAVGSVTIPTMIRAGYPRAFAGGVEATASAGGQILPPVMGAGAFLMAEFLNVPYSTVALAALPPAILYFAAIFVSCDLLARRLSLAPEEGRVQEDAIGLGEVVSLTLPVVVLGWLLFNAYTPTYAGIAAVVALLATSAAVRMAQGLRGGVQGLDAAGRQYVRDVFSGFAAGGKGLMTIAVLLACSSLLVAALTSSGLAIKISDLLVGLSGDSLFVLLLLAAITCLLMGMDVPTTASYVLTISVVGPSLVRLGLEPLNSHLFVFYFAILSAITPPVCASVYAAATIVNENFWKVAGQALRIAGAAYFIPFMFIYRPGVLGQGTFETVVTDLAVTSLGVLTFSCASIGYLMGPLAWHVRAGLFAGSVLLFADHPWSDYLGLLLLAALLAAIVLLSRRRESVHGLERAGDLARRREERPIVSLEREDSSHAR